MTIRQAHTRSQSSQIMRFSVFIVFIEIGFSWAKIVKSVFETKLYEKKTSEEVCFYEKPYLCSAKSLRESIFNPLFNS